MDLDHRNEVILVPTYRRPEHLFLCLSYINAFAPEIPVCVFPDRGTYDDPEFKMVMESFDPARFAAMYVADHDYHGNSYNTMEAFRWAYSAQNFDLIYLVEDDVMVHPDFFKWHREVHEDKPDIFGSMAWVFNRYAPITEDRLFQPWYYSIGTCFKREKLGLIARHATPRYYADMQGYIEKTFKGSALNFPHSIQHYEQDGLIQRILDVDQSQTVSCGIAKCTHAGLFGYNRGWNTRSEFFANCSTFDQRLARLNKFVCDPYWRSWIFGRDVVEREIGKVLPKRVFKYKVKIGEYESELESELTPDLLRRVNSVTVSPEMEIVVMS